MILAYRSSVVATGNHMLALSVLQTLHVAYECNCVIISSLSSVLTRCSLDTVSCLLMRPILRSSLCVLFTHYLYGVSQKNPFCGFLTFPPNSWDFLVQILRAYCRFLTTLDCNFLSNYLQVWRSYAIATATNQRIFRPMVDILSIWWWSRLIWHNFVKVAGNWIKICSPA